MVCQRDQNVIGFIRYHATHKMDRRNHLSYNDFSWQDASNRTSGGNNTSFKHNLSLRISQPLFTYNRTKMQLKELEYALENAKISYALQQLSIEKTSPANFTMYIKNKRI